MRGTPYPTALRALHIACALVVVGVFLFSYWPLLGLLDLQRADTGFACAWESGAVCRVSAVDPGSAADSVGIRSGDSIRFDPVLEADWILAGYRPMPEGFTGTVELRRGQASLRLALSPRRVAFLPTANDRIALVARLTGTSVGVLLAALIVCLRPGFISWSNLMVALSIGPAGKPFWAWYLAFVAGQGTEIQLPPLLVSFTVAVIPFAMALTGQLQGRSRPQWLCVLLLLTVWVSFIASNFTVHPFVQDRAPPGVFLSWVLTGVLANAVAIALVSHSALRGIAAEAPRLRWIRVTLVVQMAAMALFVTIMVLPANIALQRTGEDLSTYHWIVCLQVVVWHMSVAYALLRERIVDVQFTISRTVVFSAISGLALLCIGTLDWLLGRLIHFSQATPWLDGIAAVTLGVMLNRVYGTLQQLVDRLLFRAHHRAEQELRRVIAALPWAGDDRTIATALVQEPARLLRLASAALFYRERGAGPMPRLRAHGWSDTHLARLDPESLLVRTLQADHAPLALDDAELLPPSLPEGARLPVLAIPLLMQHTLVGVMLYGAHLDHALPDPDEVKLLHALALAATAAHQQVRIDTLQRERDAQLARVRELEAANNGLKETIGLLAGHAPDPVRDEV